MSRLVGSPPGYVGYEDEDMFVSPLRRRSSRVVLLEDFDRAHPRIQERILRILEEGEIADTRGSVADASNAIFVLTVNTASVKAAGKIGFGTDTDTADGSQILDDHDRVLASRLREHVDAVIAFRPLGDATNQSSEQLVNRRLSTFAAAMQDEYLIEIVIGEGLRNFLLAAAIEAVDARAIQAIVEDELIGPVTDALLEGGCGPRLKLDRDDDGKIVLSH